VVLSELRGTSGSLTHWSPGCALRNRSRATPGGLKTRLVARRPHRSRHGVLLHGRNPPSKAASTDNLQSGTGSVATVATRQRCKLKAKGRVAPSEKQSGYVNCT
jgi:hypothetical protein